MSAGKDGEEVIEDSPASLTLQMKHSDTWKGRIQGVHFEIKNWAKEMEYYEGGGCWNYYVWFIERDVPEFEAMWLPDEIIKTSPESQGFVTNKYGSLAASDVYWHGGVTYYAKHGSLEGFRSVEMGCDYAHLFDRERGYGYDLQEVLSDCERTISELVENNIIAPSVDKGNEKQ